MFFFCFQHFHLCQNLFIFFLVIEKDCVMMFSHSHREMELISTHYRPVRELMASERTDGVVEPEPEPWILINFCC